MYIPQFWCGFILGALAAMILIAVWAVWYGRRH